MKHRKPNRHQAAATGWSNRGHYEIVSMGAENPPRQGCWWNPKECFDLIDRFTSGVPIAVLAAYHQRTESAVDQQLPRALLGVEQYFERVHP